MVCTLLYNNPDAIGKSCGKKWLLLLLVIFNGFPTGKFPGRGGLQKGKQQHIALINILKKEGWGRGWSIRTTEKKVGIFALSSVMCVPGGND